MHIKNVIFDLDGTLIDSSASLLAGFESVFSKSGLKPVRPLTADIIGPPLYEILQELSGSNDPEVLSLLATDFKGHYDEVGYRETTVFPGIEVMLAELTKQNLNLYVATNKRLKPTLLILQHLQWIEYFSGVYAPDSITPPARSKADLLSYVLDRHCMDPRVTLYVGDRVEDSHAALANDMRFAFATWGYGEPTPMSNSDRIHTIYMPEQVLNCLHPGN